MVDYGLVSRAINRVSDDIRRGAQQERADELSMANLGLQKAGMDIQAQKVRGSQALQLAHAKRQQFLDEEVTGRQAIMTNPKWNDEQKQAMLKIIPKEILDGVPFKRGAWATAMQKAMTDARQEAATSKYRSEMLGLMRERIRAQGGKTSTADRKYTDNVNLQNLMGKYNISQDLDGNLKSPNMTSEQAQAMKAKAAQMGLNVYFDQGEVEDVGSRLNPFDNKTVQVFTVRSIAPSGGQADTGLIQAQQPGKQTVQASSSEDEAQRIISTALAGKPSGFQAPAPQQTGLEQPREKVQSFEEYAAQHPEEASKSGLEAMYDYFVGQSPEKKKEISERRRRRDRRAFLRQGPAR